MPRDSKYHQGRFNPQNPEKYKGDYTNIIYRSSWEADFMRWCDRNSNILEWGSEEFFINYLDTTSNKVRRYYPDFLIKVKESDESIRTYIIEVKPERQTKPPKQSPNKQRKTYITEALTYEKNMAKWKAAKEWCDDRNITFKIITENELNRKK
jgi:hypothetical protein